MEVLERMMGNENANQMNFFSEMSEYQITAREFFSTVLLDSLYRNFGFNDILISYFDTHGNFLSWTNRSGALIDYEGHPYRRFMENDVVRYRIYIEAVRDHLTYFNVEPRLYKATDVIGEKDYENSPYVRFLEENFRKHYSVTLAFGINAYIQAAFFKSKEDGDFTEQEIEELKEIYVYVANSYKNFKKYEQAKIIANIQSEIIASGEKAFLVTDDFTHVMSSIRPPSSIWQTVLARRWWNTLTVLRRAAGCHSCLGARRMYRLRTVCRLG